MIDINDVRDPDGEPPTIGIGGDVVVPKLARRLTALRLALRRHGYRPVPVAGVHLAIKSAGKRPLMKGWETVCAAADEAEISRWTVTQRDCTNTGLLCGEIVGIDIDVPVEGLAAQIEMLAREMLGDTPLKRIGRPPKLLLVFQTEEPLGKIQTSELLLSDNVVARVEVLASGQQFVAFGIHPETQADYVWPDRSPLDLRFVDLPAVTAEQCAAFVERAESVLRQAGGQTKAERISIDREGRRTAGLAIGASPTREIVADALSHIPNRDLPYDDWIKVGLALYAALGTEARDLWEGWSAQSNKNDAPFTADKWESFAGVHSVTVGTLFWLAGQQGWRRSDRRRMRPARQNADHQSTHAPALGGRPTIRVVGGELPRIVDEAEIALIAANRSFYQRGSLVVRPTMAPIANADGRWTLAPRLVHVRGHHVAEAMTAAANWQRYDARLDDWVPMDCTLRIAETYLARDGLWHLPVLTGIINCPTLRPDGSLLDTPGYDAATGLLFDRGNESFPQLTPEPDKNEAGLALRFLRDLIGTFPFLGDADRAVALSGILTAVVRRSLPTAPLHGFNAPTAGSGKSMLVDIASMISAGRPAAVIAQGKTEEEMEKRLGAAFIAGDPLISIDNCDGPLGGELLCQALTQLTLKVRVLGKSLNAEVPSNAAIYATGNNLTLTGDLTRRALRCSLDPGVERPELRAFDRDPIAVVKADRGNYVAAALTILRAFHVADRPQQSAPLGSFAEWSRWVRDALVWLGEADPCATMDDVRAADPGLEALTMVVEQWHAVLGSARVSVKQAIDAAVEQRAGGFLGHPEFVNPEFREALLAVAGDRGAVSGRRLGKWLGTNKNRIVGGLKFMSAGTIAGLGRWRLADASGRDVESAAHGSGRQHDKVVAALNR